MPGHKRLVEEQMKSWPDPLVARLRIIRAVYSTESLAIRQSAALFSPLTQKTRQSTI
jgi:hypothetical protein